MSFLRTAGSRFARAKPRAVVSRVFVPPCHRTMLTKAISHPACASRSCVYGNRIPRRAAQTSTKQVECQVAYLDKKDIKNIVLINLPRQADLSRNLPVTKFPDQKRGSDEEKPITSRGAFGSNCSKHEFTSEGSHGGRMGEGTMLALPSPTACQETW